jgi:catechol 2,3-dioxygenase-like lactoylglutathione lyase family enzyme
MLDHLSIQCADLPSAAQFYDAVLEPLGGKRLMEMDDVIGYGVGDRPTFWLGVLNEGGENRPIHVAFMANNRAAVRGFFDVAVAAGSEVLHEPKLWPIYHPGFYGAFVRDPDGNNVEAACHIPE